MDTLILFIFICILILISKLSTIIRYLDLLAHSSCYGTTLEDNYHNLHQKFFMTKKMRKRLLRKKRRGDFER